MTSAHSYSGFLSLPTELRCHIYHYLLSESHAVTVGAAYTTVFGNRIRDRARKIDIPGLPLDLVPLVRCERDISLLSVVKPPTIALDDANLGNTEAAQLVYPAPLALLQTCHQINDELTDFKRGMKRMVRARSSDANTEVEDQKEDTEGLSLYVTYPYGVLVLKSMYPFLLKQARRVYISGHYSTSQNADIEALPSFESGEGERLTPSSSFTIAESFGTPAPIRSSLRRRSLTTSWRSSSSHGTAPYNSAARPRLRLDPPLSRQQRQTSRTSTLFPSFSESTCTLAPAALAHLVRTLLPPKPTQLIKLSARILYPGENSYTTVWSDNNSPVTHILRNICGGKIDMQVKRGGLATGLCLTAKPKPESRVVSTSWENWRSGGRGRGGPAARVVPGRTGVEDLDGFLTDEA